MLAGLAREIMTLDEPRDGRAMQIERLRLVGFKSFVEATELAIEPA